MKFEKYLESVKLAGSHAKGTDLRDSDIDVDDIGLSRPSLDDVFLSLTGHRTEEEEVEA